MYALSYVLYGGTIKNTSTVTPQQEGFGFDPQMGVLVFFCVEVACFWWVNSGSSSFFPQVQKH